MKALADPPGEPPLRGRAAGATDVLAYVAGWAAPGRAKDSADAQRMVPEDARSAPNHHPSDSALVLRVMGGGGGQGWGQEPRDLGVLRLEAMGMPGTKEELNPEPWGTLA